MPLQVNKDQGIQREPQLASFVMVVFFDSPSDILKSDCLFFHVLDGGHRRLHLVETGVELHVLGVDIGLVSSSLDIVETVESYGAS